MASRIKFKFGAVEREHARLEKEQVYDHFASPPVNGSAAIQTRCSFKNKSAATSAGGFLYLYQKIFSRGTNKECLSDSSTTSRATKHVEGSLEHKRVGAEAKITVSNQSKPIPNKNLSQLDISEQVQNGQRHKITFHPNPEDPQSFSGRNCRTVLVEHRHIVVSSPERRN